MSRLIVVSNRVDLPEGEDVRAGVYEQSPEVERSMDPDRLGVAVLVDLDEVRGRQQGEAFEMSR